MRLPCRFPPSAKNRIPTTVLEIRLNDTGPPPSNAIPALLNRTSLDDSTAGLPTLAMPKSALLTPFPLTTPGVVSGNGVSNALFGIASVGSPAVLSSNDVRLSSAGIALEGGGPVSFNRISNTVVGILFFADGGNLQGNRIVSSSQAGVEFSCFVGSARNNVISDTQV